jgi:hypothetical protein
MPVGTSQLGKGDLMKKIYEKPTLSKREKLSGVTASPPSSVQ